MLAWVKARWAIEFVGAEERVLSWRNFNLHVLGEWTILNNDFLTANVELSFEFYTLLSLIGSDLKTLALIG